MYTKKIIEEEQLGEDAAPEKQPSNLMLTYEERLFLSEVLLSYQAMLRYSRQTMFEDAAVAVTEQMEKIAVLNKKILNVDEQKRKDYMNLIADLNETVTTEERRKD